jgi:hypothetical protein
MIMTNTTNIFRAFTVLALLLIWSNRISAQSDTMNPNRIVVFAPLYLDSAYDASGNYKFGKTMPKFLNAGLEFYQGLQFAIDSLQKKNAKLDIHIIDTKSKTKLETVLQKAEVKTAALYLGYVNVNEAAALAKAANSLSIPFVNLNLPNDAGVKNNSNYFVMNPTLGTHCSGIYKYLQKSYALSTILYFRKKGATDDRLRSMFAEVEKSTASVPLKIKYITVDDSVSAEQLAKYLDSSKNNVCLIASLDNNFSIELCKKFAILSKNYPSTLIGMPTWEQIDFSKSAYRGVEIVYSSQLYINPDNRLVSTIQKHFKSKYFTRAGDLVFSTFETLFHFGLQVSEPRTGPLALGKKSNTLFGEIDIQPVLNKQSGAVEYYENKKLYFIKKQDGSVKGVY